jgi:hypothetical protein
VTESFGQVNLRLRTRWKGTVLAPLVYICDTIENIGVR